MEGGDRDVVVVVGGGDRADIVVVCRGGGVEIVELVMLFWWIGGEKKQVWGCVVVDPGVWLWICGVDFVGKWVDGWWPTGGLVRLLVFVW